MRKAEEIRNLDDGQLEAEAARLREALFQLRNKDSLKQLERPHEIKSTRRELASVLTVMNERAGKGSMAGESNDRSTQTEE